MDLYIVRHGIAAAVLGPDVSDAQRPLTAKGAKRIAQIARGMRRSGVDLTGIWTSPLLRARQTAEILAQEFSLTAIHEEPALQPGSDPAALVEPLIAQPPSSQLALVGHDPHLRQLATYLLTGVNTDAVLFKKGGVARIELSGRAAPLRGHLHWLMTPRQLRRLR